MYNCFGTTKIPLKTCFFFTTSDDICCETQEKNSERGTAHKRDLEETTVT